jgi:pyruvate/2-oxoglutarate dehydrogenase complex dihydrolipoamide dehydrogenase (E3) component
VKVNDRLQTTNPRIFAAGDICSRFKFTHAADAMARIVIANALFPARQKVSALTIPWCTYTEPELAHVGVYEQAAAREFEIQTFTWDLKEVDRAVLDGETEGFARVHVAKGTDRILGATIVAAHAGDLISEVTLAMTNKLGLEAISKTIHPYPTQAEVVKKLGDAYQRTRLTPFVKKVLHRWFAWSRR